MTKTTRAPRVAEIAADEGYNLSGAPVLLAKLTAYVGRATFAQLAALATAAGGEYSKHNTAFMFTDPAARESFAAQARVILTNTAANHAKAAAHDSARIRAQRETAKHPPTELEKLETLLANQEETLADWQDDTAIATPSEVKQLKTLITATRAHVVAPAGYNEIMRFMSQPPASSPAYTDAPTVETPPAVRVSTSRPIRSTITDRTPAGYGPTQPALF